MPDSASPFEYGEAAARLFADLADPVAHVSAGSDPAALWATLEEAMFPLAWLSEDKGGAGLTAAETGQIVEAAGRSGTAVPLAETILARHWAAEAGIDVPDAGPLPLSDFSLNVPVRGLTLSDGPSLVPTTGREGVVDGLRLQASAAAFASAWIAGALRGLLSICTTYAGERIAFGRRIAQFQAIQHQIAQLATETAATELAARTALQAIDAGGGLFEAAAAKIRADEAGRTGARIGHQVFGAIGFTIEHPLHLYTGGIEAWRNRYGTGPEWAVLIGRAALSGGGAALWPNITAPQQLTDAMKGIHHA